MPYPQVLPCYEYRKHVTSCMIRSSKQQLTALVHMHVCIDSHMTIALTAGTCVWLAGVYSVEFESCSHNYLSQTCHSHIYPFHMRTKTRSNPGQLTWVQPGLVGSCEWGINLFRVSECANVHASGVSTACSTLRRR